MVVIPRFARPRSIFDRNCLHTPSPVPPPHQQHIPSSQLSDLTMWEKLYRDVIVLSDNQPPIIPVRCSIRCERRDHSRPFLETSCHRPRLADKCGTIGRENQRVIKIILRLVDIEITNSRVAFSGQKENWKMQPTD